MMDTAVHEIFLVKNIATNFLNIECQLQIFRYIIKLYLSLYQVASMLINLVIQYKKKMK